MKVSFFRPLTAALCAVLLAIPMYLPARSAHRSSQFLLNDTPFSGDAYISFCNICRFNHAKCIYGIFFNFLCIIS